MMGNLRYILVALLAALMLVPEASAQVDRREVRAGNRDFRKENYREADIDYRKALVKDSTSVAANYNLAGNLYRQGDMEQARKMLEAIKESAPATESAADYYYNMGDVAIALQDWQAAVDAFEQSLLRNPGDLNAKENYIYAQKKLQEQQNQQQNQDQNQDQNNDQNNDQNKDQNQDQNKDDQNKNDQNDDQDKKDDQKDNQQDQNQNQDQNKDQQKNQNQQQDQPKITPQAAQQMLQAIQAKEKETQDKVNKEKAEALKARQKDKNW